MAQCAAGKLHKDPRQGRSPVYVRAQDQGDQGFAGKRGNLAQGTRWKHRRPGRALAWATVRRVQGWEEVWVVVRDIRL